MDPETAHRLIHCNFQQLHLLHPASFTFEEVLLEVSLKLYIAEIIVTIGSAPVRFLVLYLQLCTIV
jgi:hypothetical protein